jgi:asparagine synthase (glutamine-hydrolysing)
VAGVCAAFGPAFGPGGNHRALVAAMAAAAPHRGLPAIHEAPHASLAALSHGGLTAAIAVVRAAGRNLTVAAHARLDNRDDLLPDLRPHLATADPSDAELILAAVLRWGAEAPRHLLGDFAYVVHDAEHQVLHAARDPMAMRPLYFHHLSGRTLVASEIQQLLATGEVADEVHEAAVARYLIGEFGVPEETFYRGVRALPAGHRLEVDARGARVEAFWTVDPERRERFAREEDYAERFRELFLQAVRARVRTADPVGLFLSGGVDSGSIASALGWLRECGAVRGPIEAYCWAYATLPQCDERHLSALVVQRYGLSPHDLDAEASRPLARYPEHGPHRDEPYIGVYQALLEDGLAAARRDGVRDMWSGDRGDLVSGAWSPSYWSLLRRRRWRDLLGEVREHAAVPGQGWPRVVGRYLVAPGLRSLVRRRRPRNATPSARHDPRQPPWLRGDLLARTCIDPDATHDAEPPEALRGYARRERHRLLFVPMHMRGMVWSERTNAAFGLGFVDPWSDRRLAEFVLAIPQAVLNRPGELGKRLVREAMRGIMPEEFRRTAAKIVPQPLFDRALRRDAVDTIRHLLTDMEADRRGYLDGDALRAHYDDVVAGGRAHVTLWWAITLEMWLRRYWR